MIQTIDQTVLLLVISVRKRKLWNATEAQKTQHVVEFGGQKQLPGKV